MAISYALSVTNLLSGVVNSFTETEKQMVSVERAQQYIDNIPAEPSDAMLMVKFLWYLQFLDMHIAWAFIASIHKAVSR